MQVAELFAGCGGLALGMSRAGFGHAAMIEFNADAVTTVHHNRARGIQHVASWPMEMIDVREVDWRQYRDKVDVVSGGPPCQPFGIGGKKRGHEDTRDMWPEAVRAVRETAPTAFLFENVRNLAGPRFEPYLEWIVQHLRYPDDLRRLNESFNEHRRRLNMSGKPPAYEVVWQVVNAADFGAPQIRFRVLVFGLARRLGGRAERMRPTHSRDRLLWDQYVTGDYWRRHNLAVRTKPELLSDQKRVANLRSLNKAPDCLPWVTVRDAIKDLGEPSGSNNHVFQPGARVYKGHTGSPLDLPAKALKAGDHGVPGGENMMVRDDGTVRYFTTREAATLVGLPDDFQFPRSWSEAMRQLGNAVPAQLGEAAGKHLQRMIRNAKAGLDNRRVA